jgi:hypothetical protein
MHPNTFLFLQIVKELCLLLNIDFFTDEQDNKYITHKNFISLPS